MRLLSAGVTMLVVVFSLTEANADTRRYSDKEIACVADALYMEGGSIKATSEELRTMAHTVKVRAETESVWARKIDWGGPDLCSVVHWKIGKKKRRVCQYSYWCRGARELRRFRNPFAVLARATLGYSEESYYPGAPIRVTYDELWLRCWRAAYAVFGEPIAKRWIPGGDLSLADTYQHWCSDQKYYLPSCKKALVSSDRSKCWFALGNTETETQLLDAHRLHIYYRSVTPEEVEEAWRDPDKFFPEACEAMGKVADKYVQRVRNGQLARLLSPEPKVASLQKPDTATPADNIVPNATNVSKPKKRKTARTRRVQRYGYSTQFYAPNYY